jgi:hypothetical protein
MEHYLPPDTTQRYEMFRVARSLEGPRSEDEPSGQALTVSTAFVLVALLLAIAFVGWLLIG